MANNSPAASVGKFGLGAGVGFALYLLISGLGLGRGRGEGRGKGREPPSEPPRPKEDEESAASTPTPTPPKPTPPRPKDLERLTFVMTQPLAAEPFNPMSFLLRAENRTYSLGGMIARVKAGGRSDVALKIRGDTRTGSGDEALAFLKESGIEVWEDKGAARVSGNARGQYGERRNIHPRWR